MANFLTKYSSLLTGTLLILLVSISFHTSSDVLFNVSPIFLSPPNYTHYLAAFCGVICFGVLGEIAERKLSITVLTGAYMVLMVAITIYLKIFGPLTEVFYANVSLRSVHGGAFVLLPVYVSEMSEKSHRGGYVTLFYLASNIGAWIKNQFDVETFYGYLQLVITILSILVFVEFLVFGEESPYYLVKKSKRNSAKLALEKMRKASTEKVDQELEEIEKKSDNLEAQKKFLKIFNNKINLKGIISVGGLLFLSTEIRYFNPLPPIETTVNEGFRDWSFNIKYTSRNIADGCSFLGLLLCSVLVDKIGRKKCLYISWLGMLYSILLVGLNFVYKEYFAVHKGKITLLDCVSGGSAITFFIFFNFGLSSVPFIMLGELFPQKFKTLNVAGIISFQIIQQVVHDILQYYGLVSREIFMLKTVLVFFLVIPFVKLCVMETIGLSLQKIQNLLRNNSTGKRSQVINLESMQENNEQTSTEIN